MPKLTPQIQSKYGLDLKAFDKFDRSWFPTGGSGVLTTEQVWPRQQLIALDSTQRALTTSLGISTGIPFFAGQFKAQGDYLSSIPALQASSPISRKLAELAQKPAEEAIEAALSLVNELGFSALQGAIAAAEQLTGVVEAIPLIGFFVKLGRVFGEIYHDALKPRSAKTIRVGVPAYDPDNDYDASSVFHQAAGTRDWTGLFSPAESNIQLASEDAPRIFTSRGFSKIAPHFAGRRSRQDGLWVFGEWTEAGPPVGLNDAPPMNLRPSRPSHFGFIPLWDGYGGQLWRGVMIDKKRRKEVTLVGDQLPTAQSMGLAMWRAAFNPTAPQIFFVNAVRLQQEWLNYLVQLRRGLHLTTQEQAIKFLRDWKDGVDTDQAGRTAARLWLSFVELEDNWAQDLSKKLDLRKRICNKMALVFGWSEWGREDDRMVGQYDKIMEVSDEDYATIFRIRQAGPVRGCVELYNRQIQACQSATVLYSRGDDPAFLNAPQLRNYRNRAFAAALQAPSKRAAVDEDMLEPAFAYQIEQQAKTLVKPGQPVLTSLTLTPEMRSASFVPEGIWLGEGKAPAQWAGRDTTTTLKVQGSGASGGLPLVLLAAAGVGAYAMLRR